MPKQIGPEFPLVVTSYEMALFDARFLSQYQWKYVVVDEVLVDLSHTYVCITVEWLARYSV